MHLHLPLSKFLFPNSLMTILHSRWGFPTDSSKIKTGRAWLVISVWREERITLTTGYLYALKSNSNRYDCALSQNSLLHRYPHSQLQLGLILTVVPDLWNALLEDIKRPLDWPTNMVRLRCSDWHLVARM